MNKTILTLTLISTICTSPSIQVHARNLKNRIESGEKCNCVESFIRNLRRDEPGMMREIESCL